MHCLVELRCYLSGTGDNSAKIDLQQIAIIRDNNQLAALCFEAQKSNCALYLRPFCPSPYVGF